MSQPEAFFHSLRYLRSNARRLEHLALMDLPIASRSVLEIGAGIGDLTPFFLDRDCTVTAVEPQAENVACFKARYESDPLWPAERLRIVQTEIAHMEDDGVGVHDVVFCYSVLNFLPDPADGLAAMARVCRELLILEVAVDAGPGYREDGVQFRPVQRDIAGSLSGEGCLPTRLWMFNRLKEHFPHVYMTTTVPAFERYRLDWSEPSDEARSRFRALFVASRTPLRNPHLVEGIPERQCYRLGDISGAVSS